MCSLFAFRTISGKVDQAVLLGADVVRCAPQKIATSVESRQADLSIGLP
jgi:hypothetical protein